MSSLGFSCYRPLGGMNWAPVLSLCQGPGRFTGLLLILLLELGGGSARLLFKLNQFLNELIYIYIYIYNYADKP